MADVQYAIGRLLDACEPLFIQQTEELSAYQMNFLHALANGVHTGFTQSSVLSGYRLGTAANVKRPVRASKPSASARNGDGTAA